MKKTFSVMVMIILNIRKTTMEYFKMTFKSSCNSKNELFAIITSSIGPSALLESVASAKTVKTNIKIKIS